MVSERDADGVRKAVDGLGGIYLESYRAAVDHAFRVRESNARLTREFFTSHVALIEEHATLNERTIQETMRLSRKQSDALVALSKNVGRTRIKLPPSPQP